MRGERELSDSSTAPFSPCHREGAGLTAGTEPPAGSPRASTARERGVASAAWHRGEGDTRGKTDLLEILEDILGHPPPRPVGGRGRRVLRLVPAEPGDVDLGLGNDRLGGWLDRLWGPAGSQLALVRCAIPKVWQVRMRGGYPGPWPMKRDSVSLAHRPVYSSPFFVPVFNPYS